MSDEIFVGQADPSATSSEFNAMTFLARQEISKVFTATLVKIVRAPYDKDGNDIAPGTVGPIGFVDVLPLVNQIDGRGVATPHGTVYRLKYHRYQSTHGSIIADPAVGDVGKMVAADRDTSSVRANEGAQSNPGSRRQFDMADGTFFGCAVDKANPTQYVTFTSKGMTLHDRNKNEYVLDDKGITITDGVSGNVIQMRPAGVIINGATITLAGEVMNAEHTKIGTHTHPQPNDGHGDAEVDTLKPNTGS